MGVKKCIVNEFPYQKLICLVILWIKYSNRRCSSKLTCSKDKDLVLNV